MRGLSSEKVKSEVGEAVDFLDAREEFWRQRRGGLGGCCQFSSWLGASFPNGLKINVQMTFN